MLLTHEQSTAPYIIKNVSPNEICVNEMSWRVPIILTQNQLYTKPLPTTFLELTTMHFDFLFSLHPNIILIGAGAHSAFLNPEFSRACHERHIGIEIMSTLSACRAYNVLAAERRNVVAVLFVTE